jgi:hypothetical protein
MEEDRARWLYRSSNQHTSSEENENENGLSHSCPIAKQKRNADYDSVEPKRNAKLASAPGNTEGLNVTRNSSHCDLRAKPTGS